MNSKQSTLGIGLIIVIVLGFALTFVVRNQDSRPAVGIIQTASHPALDAVYLGFTQALQEKAGDRCAIIYQNAEGQIPQAQTIVQSFHNNDRVKAIMSIATPTTQVAVNKERDKPVLFAAVTSAETLDLDSRQTNVAGVEDRINIDLMMQVVIRCIGAGKRVGMVYNPSEVNSVTLVEAFEKALQEQGFEPIHCGMTHESEIQQVMTTNVRKVDLMIAPTDNMVALAVERMTQITNQAKIPFIASDVLLIDKGVTAACGVNYHNAGELAGLMAYQIMFEGKSPAEVGIVRAASTVVFNETVCQRLGIDMSPLIPRRLPSLE